MSNLIYRLRCMATAPNNLSAQAADALEAKDASIEHYKSGLESAIGDITKLKALSDQLGNALDGLTVAMDLRLDDDDLSSDSRMAFEALAAWRNSK